MLSDLHLPPKLRRQVDSELQPGEAIRWIQQPIPKFFTPSSTIAVLFAIPWTSFALF
ncbi:hypothetical protein IQ266_19840 [filamentous cyanobacterium LEGE 11480]|uniref:Uncharacterized protein n=1 Tax=Romeriopsis navalis LEGE 11480 TaxID=2777977 RepID=A0A928VNR7_9CYAN|nr:hypothetical protein [Romeriopsis navalis]MBE9031993.1 hypothetical protein [Romeriopsis navalis LEGE 11480]